MSELKELDKRYLWHPFTQMKEWMEDEPLVIERGDKNYLIDTDGRRYLDGVSSLWCNIHGHRKREIDDAIREQLDKIAHSTMLGLANCPSIRLSERLVSVSPHGLEKVFYSDSGSTSVEIALKMAFQYWQQKKGTGQNTEQRDKFVYFTSSYHGDTIGSVSVGGIDLFHRLYNPLLFDSYKAYYPYCYRCPVDKEYPSCKTACLEKLKGILKRYHNNIAAIIIEPLVQGAAGIITSPPGFLRKVRDLCTEYDILMIADEVATGFGRTGKMFACEHEGVSPDILCLAKGITGGYLPLAATLATEEIFEAFLGEYRECKTFFHGHTYTGNPLACAAAIANLDLFEKGKILKTLAPKITLFERLFDRFKILPHVGEIRQKGLMVGIELVMDKNSKEPYPPEDKIGIKVCKETRRDGLIIRPLGNTIVLMPPLSIKDSELKEMTDILHKAIVNIAGA